MRRLIAGFFSRVMRTRFAQHWLSPVIAPVQLWLYRKTGGRFQVSALLVPSLVLITKGARTGQRRETPLICWPRPDGSYFVCGSNWGRASHPSWSTNLIANPVAEIVVARRRIAVRAVLLDDAEREAAWPVLDAQWPGYRGYEEQAGGRVLRIFRLVPIG